MNRKKEEVQSNRIVENIWEHLLSTKALFLRRLVQ